MAVCEGSSGLTLADTNCQALGIISGAVKEKWYGGWDWNLRRVLSAISVSRNWFETVSKFYQNM